MPRPRSAGFRTGPPSLFAAVAGLLFSAWPVLAGGSLQVLPATIELRGADDAHGLLVSLTGSDRAEDVTRRSTFLSTDAKILTVDTNGVVRPVGDGSAAVLTVFAGQTNRVAVTVRDARTQFTPSFRQDIEPLLTRAGCNMGACHGKLAGQNGFKLSLRGYAPELDFGWLTDDIGARRINPAVPEESLLVTKPLGVIPHEGKVRFAEGSRYHRTLVAWIAARAPGPQAAEAEADAAKLEILPGDRTLRPGDTQPLLARAQWPDGHTRDVTWLTQFFSNDETTVTVTPDGLVKAIRPGATSVRAHFQGQVEVIRITIPSTNVIEDWKFARGQNAVDEPVFARLKALRIPPSPRCDDATFLRRAMLDTLGTLPTADEVREFLGNPAKDKRAKLVEALLQRPEFADYWTLQLADLFQNRKERDHDVRGAKNVRAFHAWLHDQVAANRPWDALVRDVLTASGDSVSTPQIGYYTYLVGEKNPTESEVTDAVAQAFLGTRIGCARCHNHPLEKYTQDDFYHFAAFFDRLTLDRKEPLNGATTLFAVSHDERERQQRLEESEKKLKDAEAKLLQAEGKDTEAATKEFADRKREYADRKRELIEAHARLPRAWQPRTHRDVEARPLDRHAMDFSGGADPRAALAGWITSTNNAYFSGAMVNRLWKHFLGTGLVEPVDDLRASNPPSNPELWVLLQREFVAGGYDLRHVMRLILNSRTYQLSSGTLPGNETETRFYSHYYARRLPAEVMADAVSAATGVPDRFEGFPLGLRAVQLPEPTTTSYFLSLFGRSERVTACACERSGAVTLPQLLHLQNGEEMTKKVRSRDGRLSELLKHDPATSQVIEELYLTVLNRPPTAAETKRLLTALGEAKPAEALPDLFWALLNTKEFAFNH
jgi:hypothetical protein